MKTVSSTAFLDGHSHVFLGTGHEKNERKTWGVIALCGVMMIVEIVGGSLFGSLALVADGLHMSTHAAAMLIAALAYTYARRHAGDVRCPGSSPASHQHLDEGLGHFPSGRSRSGRI